jgi:hypothetical protein
MNADFSVELGPPGEEPTLDFPWSSDADNGPRYLDVKRHPERLALLSEAALYPELGELLQALNSRHSLFETAKCDVWSSDQFGIEEEDYGAKWKLSSYIDVILSEDRAAARFSFSAHEDWARSVAQLLKSAPEFSAACEGIVRRCYYYTPGSPAGTGSPEAGFYLTLYVTGYGQDKQEARKHWRMALQLVAKACLQLSARWRKS